MGAQYAGVGSNGIAIVKNDGVQQIQFSSGPQGIANTNALSALVLLATDTHKVVTNVGIGVLSQANLPAPAVGLVFRCYDANGNGLKIVATGAAKITIGVASPGNVSSANGYVQTQEKGRGFELWCIDGANWMTLEDVPNLLIG